jgi:NitT/TauT family transport system substrate-binding protein
VWSSIGAIRLLRPRQRGFQRPADRLRQGSAAGALFPLLALVALAWGRAWSPVGGLAGGPAAPPAVSAPAGAPSAGQSTPPAPLPLRVAYASSTATNTPVFVAQDRGLFREQGLDVELVLFTGTRTDQGVATGETPIGFGANVIATRLSGADLVIVAGLVNAISFTVFVHPDGGIRSPVDLRGRSVVTSTPGATNHLAWLLLLRHFGLEAHRDVSLRPTSQGQAEQLAILSQGHADAGMLSPPGDLKALQLGLVPILTVADLQIPFMSGAIGTSETYARTHPEELRRFLRAYVQSVAVARTDPESAKGILGKYTDTDDDAVLDASYRYFRDLWGRPDFRGPVESVRSLLSVLDVPGAATARPEEFIDNRFIDELHQSGFIRQSGALD